MLDKNIHRFYEDIRDIVWLDFKVAGLDNKFLDYYYAEDELYIIRDRVTKGMWFVEARSPKEALETLKRRWV